MNFFGEVLSISDDGTILAMGAPRHDFEGENIGYIKLYKYNKKKVFYYFNRFFSYQSLHWIMLNKRKDPVLTAIFRILHEHQI